MNAIYLDHNATTRLHPLVIEAMADIRRESVGNPSSQHQFGQRARQLVEQARDDIARLLGASVDATNGDRLIFTSGGTEANNLAVLGFVGGALEDRTLEDNARKNIVISPIEHPSLTGAADHLAAHGFDVRRSRVLKSGIVDADHLNSLVDENTQLVSLMLGNNETGVLQPVGQVAQFCRERNIAMHTDAVQVAGKQAIDFQELQVTSLSVAAHKFHGPLGIGCLLVRSDAKLSPLLFGGFQQWGLRPGTLSTDLIIGMARALSLWRDEATDRFARMETLRDQLEATLLSELDDVAIIGKEAPRLPHTSNVAFLGLDRQAILMALDMAGVACSTGSACASGSSEPSPVLIAMNCPTAVIEGSLRISLGALTTAAEVAEASQRIIRVIKNLRRKK